MKIWKTKIFHESGVAISEVLNSQSRNSPEPCSRLRVDFPGERTVAMTKKVRCEQNLGGMMGGDGRLGAVGEKCDLTCLYKLMISQNLQPTH